MHSPPEYGRVIYSIAPGQPPAQMQVIRQMQPRPGEAESEFEDRIGHALAALDLAGQGATLTVHWRQGRKAMVEIEIETTVKHEEDR